jgi:hypothetical protein
MEDTIMKKTYINPKMLIVKIHAQQLLSGSALGKETDIIITDEGDVLSREFEFEEDDFDMDEEEI